VTPVGFIMLRFSIGALVLAPLAIRSGWRAEPSEGLAGDAPRVSGFVVAVAVFGTIGFAGYWFQNAGLQHTTTSNSAFITGLFVVFTPIVETIARRVVPRPNVLAAVVIAVVGLFLLTGGRPTLGKGDALTLGCAACFGVWIYLGGQYAQRYDPIALTTLQMAVFAVLAVPFVVANGIGHVDGGVLLAAAFTGIVCSAFAFTLQLWGQRYVEPSRAAVILLCEPVVAGIVGYAIGERLGVGGYMGAALILAAIVVAESRAWSRRASRSS
jgi:drug/metabolite transporter (DMT)-like permease